MTDTYSKTGYLNSDFKIFHITDTEKKEFDFHYHDFYKVLILISGNISYIIEGKHYQLQPYDTLLVNAGDIHKPVINDDTPYERIIVYISSSFFDAYRTEEYDLFHCFQKTRNTHSNLIRSKQPPDTPLYQSVLEFAESFHTYTYAASLFQEVKFIEYMILLNHSVINDEIIYTRAVTKNETVLKTMHYINTHLTETLSIDIIAGHMFLNRSYLMHLFKSETGYTIGEYITEKRLFLAKRYIQSGMSVTDACYKSGFKNYSSFYHAFTKRYDFLPKDSTEVI